MQGWITIDTDIQDTGYCSCGRAEDAINSYSGTGSGYSHGVVEETVSGGHYSAVVDETSTTEVPVTQL